MGKMTHSPECYKWHHECATRRLETSYADAKNLIDEIAALRAEVERSRGELRGADDELKYQYAIRKRLEEAVEWACSYNGAMYYEDHHCIWGEFERELRRKAGKEG